MIECRFLPKDFVGGILPAKVGDVGIVRQFFGRPNVRFIVTEHMGGAILARLEKP